MADWKENQETDLESERVDTIVSLMSYKFKCDLYNAGYVGFTRCHLHQLVQKHRNSTSSIGRYFRVKHSLVPKDLTNNVSVLKKCTKKFECLL